MKIITVIFLVFFAAMMLAAQDYKLESSADCAVCHEAIYDDWQQSMHARSTAEADPLYQGMRAWASEETRGKSEKLCNRCHYPYSQIQDNKLISEDDTGRAVDCVYCHSIENVDKPARFSSTKYSARSNNKSDYHVIEARPHFEREALCFKCHADFTNPKGTHICITAVEYEGYAGEKGACNRCHMPLKKGLRSSASEPDSVHSHHFSGPHTEGFLKGTLKLTMAAKDKMVEIAIDNSDTPHAYPTGSPLRSVVLKVMGFDDSGKLVYQNWKSDPVAEDKQAAFVRIFSDEAGNAPVPPWRASEVKSDTRLKAGEQRMLSYQMPENVTSVKSALYFRLAPPQILKKLKIDDPYLNASHLIKECSLKLN